MHDSPETLSNIRTLCILLQEPKFVRFALINHTNNEHVEKLQDGVYEKTQETNTFT